jgi:hypothetical protein
MCVRQFEEDGGSVAHFLASGLTGGHWARRRVFQCIRLETSIKKVGRQVDIPDILHAQAVGTEP